MLIYKLFYFFQPIKSILLCSDEPTIQKGIKLAVYIKSVYILSIFITGIFKSFKRRFTSHIVIWYNLFCMNTEFNNLLTFKHFKRFKLLKMLKFKPKVSCTTCKSNK